MTSHDDLMTAREAQEYLGVSNRKMTQLLASGALTSQPDPLDRRVKLIPRAEVEAIKAQSAKKDAA